MARLQPIRARPGRRSGEFVIALPPGWELRLRRILKELMSDVLPNPHEKGLRPEQRQARLTIRRQRMREGMCRFISELVTAEIVGKEVALSTRGRFGMRRGSLREQVEAILREERPMNEHYRGHGS
jgi:hypothetical protein